MTTPQIPQDAVGNPLFIGSHIVKPGRVSSSVWVTIYRIESFIEKESWRGKEIKVKAKPIFDSNGTEFDELDRASTLELRNLLRVELP